MILQIVFRLLLLLIACNLILCYRYVDSNEIDENDELRGFIDYNDDEQDDAYINDLLRPKYHVNKQHLKAHPKSPSFLRSSSLNNAHKDEQLLLEALVEQMLNKKEIQEQADELVGEKEEARGVETFDKVLPSEIAQSENGILVASAQKPQNITSIDHKQETIANDQHIHKSDASLLNSKKLSNDHVKVESINMNRLNRDPFLFYVLIATCTVAGVLAVVATGYCWITVKRNAKRFDLESDQASLSKSQVVLSGSFNNGDRKLAQSAQMYHYQHQKQQMLAMEKASKKHTKGSLSTSSSTSSDDSDAEAGEGDYTVYECPGLASTGEMEVKNPLFKEVDLLHHQQQQQQPRQCSSLIETTINEDSNNQLLPSSSPSRPSNESMNVSTTAAVPKSD